MAQITTWSDKNAVQRIDKKYFSFELKSWNISYNEQIMVQRMNSSFRLQPNEKQHNHKAVQNLRVYKGVTRTGCWQAA